MLPRQRSWPWRSRSTQERRSKPGGTTIDDVARVAPGGKTLELSGLITCTNCVSFRLGLTVTQGQTATLA
jgi:hypothetical protein